MLTVVENAIIYKWMLILLNVVKCEHGDHGAHVIAHCSNPQTQEKKN